jgi:ankyrin repeat protein
MSSNRWNWIGTLSTTIVAVALASSATAQDTPAVKPAAPAAAPATDKPAIKPGGPTAAPTATKENPLAPRRAARPGDAVAPTGETPGKQAGGDPTAAAGPAGTAIPNEPPVVEFDPPIADMGEMIADVAKTVVVKIKNISDQPVRISKAIPGCGCTTPTWPKDPIPPGGSGDCEITLRPGSKQGIKLSKKVTFQLENHAPVTLTVEGNVVAYVTMVPDMLDSPADAASGSAKPTDVVLESTDGTAFKVLEVNPPVVKNIPLEAKTKHTLAIDWATWSESGSQPKIMFKTDHPKAASMTMLVKRQFNAPNSDAPNAPRTPPAGPGTTALINAVRAGDLAKISSELAGGADVNERDRTGQRTALHWAAKGGNRAAMEKLFEAKADPNVKDRQGRSPLWGAVETDLETVKLLLDKGADVNARDQINSSPLLWAAGFGKPETVGFLITKGADVKATDDNGWTPLIWAAGLGQPQTVELLVKAGADLKAADKQTGDTPLLRGARTGKVESLKILIDAGADISAKNKLGQTSLHLAAASGSPEKVAILLAAKADPAALDDKGWAPIDHAMNRTTGDKAKLLELLKPVSPEPKVTAPAAK